LADRVVVIVDDGFATGATAHAACQVARAQGAKRIVLAEDHRAVLGEPIGSGVVEQLGHYADEVVCLGAPVFFVAAGQGYRHFVQTSDAEVCALLDQSRDEFSKAAATTRGTDDPALRDEEIRVADGPVTVAGHLTIPKHPKGIVVFVHGGESGRRSPNNRYVAGVLNAAGLATMLHDPSTSEEERNRAYVFDVDPLATRLVDVTRWLAGQDDTASLPIGYFGASTAAGAALRAAADPRVTVGAVVSGGGRPDLADEWLTKVRTPTLLIVGIRDEDVLDLNRQAQGAIRGECQLAVVPGATNDFEEPGTLAQVAELARDWFTAHLTGATPKS
jgi:putative phosphoribosyl transferase